MNHSVDYNQKQTRVHETRGSATNSFKKTCKLEEKQTSEKIKNRTYVPLQWIKPFYSQSFLFFYSQMTLILFVRGLFPPDLNGRLNTQHHPHPIPINSLQDVGSNCPRMILYSFD